MSGAKALGGLTPRGNDELKETAMPPAGETRLDPRRDAVR